MFVPWSLQVLAFVQAIFKFLLGLGVGAALSIYSKHGGEYANSMRWTQQDGIIEMASTFIRSRRTVPHTIKFAMALTFVASLFASVADNGAVIFIHPTTRDNIKTTTTKESPQVTELGLFTSFVGWSTSILYRSNVVDAMANMINSTKNIPDAALGQRYTPKLYPYEIGCNKLNIQLLDINFSNLTFPRTDGCAAAGFALSSSFDADYSTLKTANVSENRVSLTVDGVSQNFLFLDGLSVYAILSKDNTTCHTADVTDDYFSPLDLSDLFSNLMSYPKTTVTKCVLQSGEVKVISLSTTRFMSSSAAQFRVSADAVFDEYDELLQSMGSAVGNAAYASNSTMFLEVRSNNTSIDSVSCYSFKDVETILLSCVYLNINMLILKQQEINVDITNARDGREFSIQPKYTTAMAIRHIPKMPHSLPENTPISMMKNATLAAAQYMASLGQNFYADYAEEQLYVVFDVADIEEGLEIPDWLVAVVIALAVSSFSLWAWTMKSLESIFTNSMYDVVSKSIKGVSPVIMRSKINPLQVDACLVIPNNNNLNDNNANNKDNNSDGEDDEHDHYSGMEGHKLFRERYVNAVGKEEIEMTDIA